MHIRSRELRALAQPLRLSLWLRVKARYDSAELYRPGYMRDVATDERTNHIQQGFTTASESVIVVS